MREIVDSMDDILSEGEMDDATAARLCDLANDLSDLANKTEDTKLIGAVDALIRILVAGVSGYAIKTIIDHLADVGGLL